MRTLKNQGQARFVAGIVAVLGTSSEASALQPVDAFVRAARQANPANREAAALEAQRTAEAQVATGRLYPAISATGTYTRNQYPIALTLPASTQSITIQPQNQLDGAHQEYYLLQAILSWRVDATLAPAVRAASAAAAGAQARSDRAHRDEDAIFLAWHQIRTDIERGRSARAQVSAARLASDLARDRYSVGAATQLDVIQAEQDSFRAEVARIQTDTDLAYARAALRLYGGHLLGVRPQ